MLAALLAATPAACGSHDPANAPTGPARHPLLGAEQVGRSGAESRHACDLVSVREVARLAGAPKARPSARANDSLDLSSCAWRGGRIALVRLSMDSATHAELRFYNLLAEQQEYFNADPGLRPRQLRGVGQDSAYGGAGAWWTPARRQLVAFARKRLLRVTVVVLGAGDRARRHAAADLARLAFRRLRGS